ncbi:SMI1/KNR4 family protein [Chryseobacterium sp. PS-8]|uniref:SMI1/KNR4 family protein n=1 Tax=Chryseobacterium indicum TaxID=2766954 RepID=A0ABS9CBH9_9FLAO|nr:SMI1/KNR4 family protein [Chryseobacterium sp. PS-8]MCF2220681.1 SMI1/KNR4 family protein [Chryseobacterium sp. PS-8]
MENIITKNFVEAAENHYKEGVQQEPDNEVAEECLRMCLILEKKDAPYTFFEDPIIDLVKNYVVDTFDMGMIHFYDYDDLSSDENFIVFGSDGSGELIAIHKKSNKIYMIDGYFEEICVLCNSSEDFLNNLLKIGNANIKKVSNEEKNCLGKEIAVNPTSLGYYLNALSARIN